MLATSLLLTPMPCGVKTMVTTSGKASSSSAISVWIAWYTLPIAAFAAGTESCVDSG